MWNSTCALAWLAVVCLLALGPACDGDSNPTTPPEDTAADTTGSDVGGADASGHDAATDTHEPDPWKFEPVLLQTSLLTTEALATADDFISEAALEDGEAYQVEMFEVPGFLCVRKDGGDLGTFPEGAEIPGEPARVTIFYPEESKRENSRLAFIPHGNGSESLEELIVLLYQDFPDVYDMLKGMLASTVESYTNQCNLPGAMATIRGMVKAPVMVEFLRRGWTVVNPTNCWGDSGVGEGEEIQSFYKAKRWTRVFDRGAIDFARERIGTTEPTLAMGASGGGARTIQLILNDPDFFYPVVLDSPGDYAAGGLAKPVPSSFTLLESLTDDLLETIVERWLEAFQGGVEGSKDYSLGYRLGVDVDMDDVPILMGYVTDDPLMNGEFYAVLAAALQDPTKHANALSEVHEIPGDKHCPFASTPELWPTLFAWIEATK